MSLDSIIVPKKGGITKENVTSSNVKSESKKEGSSLFDSILSDIKKETKPEKEPSTKTQTNSNTQNSDSSKAQVSEKSIKGEKEIKSDLKDEKAKSNTQKSQLLDAKIEALKGKEEITELKSVKGSQEVKQLKENVDSKVKIIKEAVSEVKEQVSKIVKNSIADENSEDSEKEIKSDLKDEKVKSNTQKSQLLDAKIEALKGKEEITELKSVDGNEEVKQLKQSVDEKAQIIDEAAQEIKKDVSKIVIVTSDLKKLESKIENNSKVEISNQTKTILTDSNLTTSDQKIDNKNSFIANGFLNSQKVLKQKVSMEQLSQAKKNIEENKNVKAIKDSAKMLDLNPSEEVEVESKGAKGETKEQLITKKSKENIANFSQNQSLNKLLIDKQKPTNLTQTQVEEAKKTKDESEQLKQQELKAQALQNSSNEKSSLNAKEINVTLNVPQNVVETMQSKIIGAHQKMGSFMSEVARNMYLNYKPPFTSFRMSLNPANLGTISIIMRASKTDNSVSVSMNMSSSSTMEAFSENRVSLQTSLQRQLGENSNVTLNFGMQQGDTNGGFEQSNQNNSDSNSPKGEVVDEDKELEEAVVEDNDYM